MSWKIYGGRRLDGDVGAAYRSLLAVKPEAERLCQEIEAKWVAVEAAKLIDQARVEGRRAHAPASTAWKEFERRQRAIETDRLRDPEVDPEFEIWLFPDVDGEATSTLAMLQTEQPVLRDWFDALPFVHDHSWGRYERPGHLSDEVWEAREVDWKRALPKGTPSDRCLRFRLAPSSMPYVRPEDVLAQVPSLDVRLAGIAGDQHRDERVRTLHDGTKDGAMAVRASDVFRTIAEADRDTVRRAVLTEELRHFIREITERDLLWRDPEHDVSGIAPKP